MPFMKFDLTSDDGKLHKYHKSENYKKEIILTCLCIIIELIDIMHFRLMKFCQMGIYVSSTWRKFLKEFINGLLLLMYL